MHINAIKHFAAEYPTVKESGITTSGINKEIVKPKTLGTNQPYFNKYIGVRDPNTGVPYTSSATVFVSHAWKYKFYEVVVAVMEQYASKHQDVYFWFDHFTIKIQSTRKTLTSSAPHFVTV